MKKLVALMLSLTMVFCAADAFADGVTFTTVRDPENGEKVIVAAMDGSRKENLVPGLAGRALASACWLSDNLLRLTLRMVETCNEQYYDFTFTEDQVLIESYSNHTFSQGQKKKALYAC